MSKVYFSQNYWYTSSFIKEANEICNRPPFAFQWIPASYNYRLTLLSRNFFTIRSDTWNFMGRDYSVDYLHPLLDSDLVEFCTSIPIHYYKNYPNRNMIKTAMNSYISKDLLVGIKRKAYVTYPSTEKVILLSRIKETKQHLHFLKNTFASTVFDYKKLHKLLDNQEKNLDRISNNHENTLNQFTSLLNKVNRTIDMASYLNLFFE